MPKATILRRRWRTRVDQRSTYPSSVASSVASPFVFLHASAMACVDADQDLVPLVPAVQNYAWGISPAAADSVVARMHAYASCSEVDAKRPYAELWVGTHASGPAVLRHHPDVTLADFLEKRRPPGAEGPTLPYLLKVLSVAKPLSIQAHPDKQLAKRLHADNPSAYKDENHKPEMCVALTGT